MPTGRCCPSQHKSMECPTRISKGLGCFDTANSLGADFELIDPANYKSISSGFVVLLKEQGARGFFRGWVPCLVKVLRGLASLGSTSSLRRPTQIWMGLTMP